MGNRICAAMINKENNLLNLGCGNGVLFKYVKNKKTYGLDISKESLSKTKINFPDVELIHADVCDMSLIPNECFGSVCAVYLLEHVKDLPKALKEISRVIKPDGEFIISIPSEDWLYSLGRKLTTKRQIEKRYEIDYEKFVKTNEHVNTTAYILEELKKQFKISYMFGIPLLIFIKCRKMGKCE
jgi:ubiquinone/menaquinone biosynthesis C-methylase UbiE